MNLKKKLLLVVSIVIISGFVVVRNDYFEIAKQIEIFVSLYKKINTGYVDELNHGKLMNTAIRSMLDQLDPYTVFYDEQDIEYSRMSTDRGVGIGARWVLSKDKLVITDVYKDRPADRSGLRPGDKIIAIDNTSIKDFGIATVELLKGKKGSKISLTYTRRGKSQKTILALDNTFSDAVPYYGILEGNIGYIVLKEFSQNAFAQTKEALEGLKVRGIQSLILDLRSNPGGLLNQAVDIVSLFTPKKQLVVFTKSRVEAYNKIYQTKRDPIDTKIPVVVLINEHSASASEIVSGTLQDIDRAVIVGSRSFGKGLVQIVEPIAYGTQLKMTISRYYTPSGRCIQALDYAHRDENGKAIRSAESDYRSYVTKAGRAVYDGGGIMPDVVTPSLSDNGYLNFIERQRLIFDFATEYYYKNPDIDTDNFAVSDRTFEDFKKYVRNSNLSTNREDIEYQLKDALDGDIASSDKAVKSQIQSLLQTINTGKTRAMEENRSIVVSALSREILRRYIYDTGLYEYDLMHDASIQKAKDILQNIKTYQKLLTL